MKCRRKSQGFPAAFCCQNPQRRGNEVRTTTRYRVVVLTSLPRIISLIISPPSRVHQNFLLGLTRMAVLELVAESQL
jgi:hypothetical protein